MYFGMQMICYLVIFDQLPIPSCSNIFLEEITKAIEF